MLCTVSSSVPNPIPALLPAAYFPPYGVTGTLTASAWADQSGNGRDLAQGTAGNQPIYLPYTGTAYAYLPGVDTCYFSTPDSASLDVTTRVSFVVRAALDDWTPATTLNVFIGRAVTPGQYAYGMIMAGSSAGTPLVYCSYNGSTLPINNACDTATGFADGSWGWLAADLDTSAGTLKFYKATDGGSNTIPSSWTQLGSTITGLTTGTIHDSSSALRVGKDTGTSGLLGKIGRAVVYSGLAPALGGAGVAIADWNADDWAETSTNGATAVSSGTGETWTLNSTGAKPATIVKSAMLMTDAAASHYMAASNFTFDQPCTWYAVMSPTGYNNGSDQVYLIGPNNVAFFNPSGGSNLALYTPAIGAAASASAPTAGAFHVFTTVFNGASSSWATDAGTANTGNPGDTNPGGFAIATGSPYGSAAPASAKYKEIVLFPAAHDAVKRYMVQRYLNTQHRCF